MAKPNWLIVDPMSGSGNSSISNSASAHTGRVAREGIVTITGIGCDPVTYKVVQTPKAEFVVFNNGSEMAANKQEGNVTIAGKSNAAKLNFSFVGDAHNVVLPESYQAAGKATANNVAIEGDPGASSEYDFSIVLALPANDTVEEINRTILVSSENGESAQIVIKQAAGDARLSVSPTEIVLDQLGTPVSVSVASNTNWSVS
jgi:hypothetical protein